MARDSIPGHCTPDIVATEVVGVLDSLRIGYRIVQNKRLSLCNYFIY